MRVVGGRFKGRRLLAFKGSSVRPTSDKVKGAIFNMLGQVFDGERVLDLFAGTGALGIEAISRGAGSVVFVDKDCALIKKNLTALGVEDNAAVIERDVLKALKGFDRKEEVFDIVFIDAPYKDAALLKDVLIELSASAVVEDGGLIICELSKAEAGALDVADLPGMKAEREKSYGDTVVLILRCQSN